MSVGVVMIMKGVTQVNFIGAIVLVKKYICVTPICW